MPSVGTMEVVRLFASFNVSSSLQLDVSSPKFFGNYYAFIVGRRAAQFWLSNFIQEALRFIFCLA
jgi:hypothetical protein